MLTDSINKHALLFSLLFIIVSSICAYFYFSKSTVNTKPIHESTIQSKISTTKTTKDTPKSFSSSVPSHTTTANNELPQTHINTLNKTLNNNLSVNGVPATKQKDGTVILHSQGRLQSISVAHIDENGDIIISEFNEPISSDITKEKQ